jgi:hypothetical protein
VSFRWPLWKAESAQAYAKHHREELERAHAGKSHGGVVFLSSKSFIQNAHGAIAKAFADLV